MITQLIYRLKIKTELAIRRNRVIAFFILFFLFFLFQEGKLAAQPNKNVSIKASATVIQNAGIEITTLQNMEIDLTKASDGIISIEPREDPMVGIMLLTGKPDARFRITFVPRVELGNLRGRGSLLFEYRVLGYPGDNQQVSEPIDALERELRFSSEGIYYLWVGGRIDISNARPGSYEGEFTLEIEYL